MADAKQLALYKIISTAVKDGVTKEFGEHNPSDNMPSRIAVALMQLSAYYFVLTKADKAVVWDFLIATFGPPPEAEPPPRSPLILSGILR